MSQNIGTAIANSYLNNVNQYGPDGSTEYGITGYKDYVDNSNPDKPITYQIPTYAETTTLSPEQQQIYNQTNATELNLATLAKDQSGFLGDYMTKPFQYDTGDHENWSMGLYDQLNSGREAQQGESLRTQLANSGVSMGSDAYSRAMGDQANNTENARNQFMLDSYKTGFSSAQATRNQPINEISALLSQSQVSQPQFGATNSYAIPTTDRAGINANYDAANMNRWQAEQQQRQQMLGGLFSFGSSMIGLSDERAKKDKEKIGSKKIKGTDKRAGLYKFRYKGEPSDGPKHTGVMAQEMLKKKPSAVTKTQSGLYAVNYGDI